MSERWPRTHNLWIPTSIRTNRPSQYYVFTYCTYNLYNCGHWAWALECHSTHYGTWDNRWGPKSPPPLKFWKSPCQGRVSTSWNFSACKKRKSWNISTLIFFPDAICSKQKTSVNGNISGSGETRLKPQLAFDGTSTTIRISVEG